jgi:hypothetical protein
VVLAIAIGTLPMAGLVAQESGTSQPKTAASAAPKPSTPLKVTVVISRWQGEKKTASLPFTLAVSADDLHYGSATLRMSEQVPVPQQTIAGGNAPVASYTYRQVGTNIDSQARSIEDGRFSVMVSIEDSQIFSDSAKATVGLPSFQTFSSTMNVILKDGQTTQYTTATDKISGEVVKVDVTLNVVR